MNAGELASERNFVKAAGRSKYRTDEQERETKANLERVYRDRLEPLRRRSGQLRFSQLLKYLLKF